MAKAKGGHRGGKAQTASGPAASANSTNGPVAKKADKENSSDLQNTNSAKGRNRQRENKKIIVSLEI